MERGDINRLIAEQNKEIEEISRQIEAYQKEAEQLKNEIIQEEKPRKEQHERQGAEAQEHLNRSLQALTIITC